MTWQHLLLALLTTMAWGYNFVIIKQGLTYFPPLLFSGLRFLLSSLLIFILPRPPISWRYITAYGILLGVIKFGLMFLGIHAGVPAGLASLLLQTQVFFTILLAALLLHEWPSPIQTGGIVVAFFGVAVIAWGHQAANCFSALLLIIAASFSWSMSNLILKKMPRVNMMHFMIWMSLVPPLPLFGLSLYFEGWSTIVASFQHIDAYGIWILFYISIVATVLAFAGWGILMSRYKAAQVAPLSLLIPVFGMSFTAFFLGERYSFFTMIGGVLIFIGLACTILGDKIWKRYLRSS